MSTAKNCYSGTGKERSSFAVTCNRLSLLIKEKGSLRDFGINSTVDVKGKPEMTSPATETEKTTVDLLSKIESPVQTSEKTEKSVTHLPQHVSVESFCKPEDSTNKGVSGELDAAAESKSGQMTIFYRGQILVFDCISADKARDMVLAATGAKSSTSNSSYEAFESQDPIIRGLEVNGSDLPIARRSSLHKFLSKRKDRASEIAPYQMPNRLLAASSSSYKFDLNL